MTAGGLLLDSYADLRNEGTPTAPASGWTRAYTKSDNGLYLKDSGGTERRVATTDDERFLHPELQSGVVQTSDAAISAVVYTSNVPNPDTLALTLSAANPLCIQGATAGPAGLTMINFPGFTGTFTAPSFIFTGFDTFPTYNAVALDVDTSGQVNANWSSGHFSTAAAAIADLPAVAVNNVRLYVIVRSLAARSGPPWVINQTADVRQLALKAGSGSSSSGTQVMFSAHAAPAASLGSAPYTPGKMALAVGTGDYDSGGFFNNASNRFQPTVAGYYHIDAGVTTNQGVAGDVLSLAVLKKGAALPNAEASIFNSIPGANYATSLSTLVYLNGADDYIELWGYCNTAAWGAAAGVTFTGWMTGYLAAGVGSLSPGQGRSTVARAWRAAPKTFVAGWNKIELDTIDAGADPGGNFSVAGADGTATKGRYTAPTTGYYQVNAGISFSSATVGAVALISIHRNDIEVSRGGRLNLPGGNSIYDLTASDIVYCQAGDYLDFRIYDSAVGTDALSGTVTMLTFMSVSQVGGVNLIGALSPTAQLAPYPAAAGQLVLMTGQNAVGLPSAPMAGSQIGINALTAQVPVNRSGTDTINLNGTALQTQIVVPKGQMLVLTYLGGAWYGALNSIGSALPLPARAYRNVALNTGAGWQKLPFDKVSFGDFDVVNGQYVCPQAGYYIVAAEIQVTFTAGAAGYCFIARNGVVAAGNAGAETASVMAAGGQTLQASAVLQCNAGDTIAVYYNTTAGQAIAAGQDYGTYVSIVPVGQLGAPSPGQGLQTAARAFRAGAGTTAAALTKIALDTKTTPGYDSGANMPTADRYICPTTGYYQVSVGFSANGLSVGHIIYGGIYKNGTACASAQEAQSGGYGYVAISDIVYCVAGDYLELWGATTAAGVALTPGANNTFLSVVQVGGVNLVGALSPTVQASDYNAGPGQLVVMNGSHAVALPNAPMAGSQVAVTAVTGTVTINRGGTDTITTPAGAALTTFTVPVGATAMLYYIGGVWYSVAGVGGAAGGDLTGSYPNPNIAVPRGRMTAGSGQTITTGQTPSVTLTAAAGAVANGMTVSGNGLKVAKAGWYRVFGHVTVQPYSGGGNYYIMLTFIVNGGGGLPGGGVTVMYSGSSYQGVTMGDLLSLNVNDVVVMTLANACAGSITINAALLTLEYIGQ